MTDILAVAMANFSLNREHRNMVGNYEIKRSRFFHLGNRREMSSRIKSDWVEKPSSVVGMEFSTRINCQKVWIAEDMSRI